MTRGGRFLLFVSMLLVMAALAAAFAAPGIFAARAEAAGPSPAPEEWYSLNEDGTVLTVSLKDAQPSYMWKYGTSEPNIIQMSDRHDEFHRWTVDFTPAGKETGDVQLTFHYLVNFDEKPLSIRTLSIHVDDDYRISLAE